VLHDICDEYWHSMQTGNYSERAITACGIFTVTVEWVLGIFDEERESIIAALADWRSGLEPLQAVLSQLLGVPAPVDNSQLLREALAARLVTNATDDPCPICMKTLPGEYVQLTCKHLFCHECIQHWVELNSQTQPNGSCPMCRGPVLTTQP